MTRAQFGRNSTQIAFCSCCLLLLFICPLFLFDFLHFALLFYSIFCFFFCLQFFLFSSCDLHFQFFICFVFFLNFQLLTFAAGSYLYCQFNDVTVKSISADVFALLPNFSSTTAPPRRRFIYM